MGLLVNCNIEQRFQPIQDSNFTQCAHKLFYSVRGPIENAYWVYAIGFLLVSSLLSSPVCMHDGLICITFCLSVFRLSSQQHPWGSSVCLSVQTIGVLLASWCVPVTTYWLLFFVGYCGYLGYIACSKVGCWLNKPTKNTDTSGKKSICSVCIQVQGVRLSDIYLGGYQVIKLSDLWICQTSIQWLVSCQTYFIGQQVINISPPELPDIF